LKVVYSARYHIDIGPHVFPTRKYPMVHARLIETGVIEPGDIVEIRVPGIGVLRNPVGHAADLVHSSARSEAHV